VHLPANIPIATLPPLAAKDVWNLHTINIRNAPDSVYSPSCHPATLPLISN
jgi:hypothetical protein